MKGVTTIVTAGVLLVTVAVFAQQPPAQATPAQKPAALAQTPAPQAPSFPEGSKLAFIVVQRIASESVEGRAASTKINELQQRRSNELAGRNKALEAAQQKMTQSGALLSNDARAQLQKEIDKQQVDIQRAQQDAQAELDELNRQLQSDFQRKLAPLVQQVAIEKGIFILFSKDDSGIVWADAGLDLTAEIVRRFDAATVGVKPPVPKAPQS